MEKILRCYRLLITIILVNCLFVLSRSFPQDKPPYASDQPIVNPRVFEVPGTNVIWHIAFTPNGYTYYIVADSFRVSNFVDGSWTPPKVADFHIPIETPFISADGKKFFIAHMDTINGNDDIKVMDKTESGWSEPRDPGPSINSAGFEGMATTSANGNLYFVSNREGSNKIYCSKWLGDNYSQPQVVNEIFNKYEALFPFIASDESYIIFNSYIQGNTTFGGIFISFNKNGSWSVPRNLGSRINNPSYYNDRPYISPDGNYLFFCCTRIANTRLVYQVDWKPTLESLRSQATWNRVYSSSNESAVYLPEYAIDNDTRTRWASQFSDQQWLMVKMDTVSEINKISLRWENAFARQYEIQTSLDSLNWQTVFTEDNGNGRLDSISFSPVLAKYVRLNCTRRATNYGYSLYEMKVYNTSSVDVKDSKQHLESFSLEQNYPNPFNPETVISYQLPIISNVTLKVYDILGKEVAALVDEEQAAGSYTVKFRAGSLSSGIYFYKLRAGNYTEIKKMMLLR